MGDVFVITETSRGLINSTLETVIMSGQYGERIAKAEDFSCIQSILFLRRKERGKEEGERGKKFR